MELELGPDRRGVGRSGGGAVPGEAQGPDLPPHLHQPHFLQAQHPRARRRGYPHRPRHQPQRRPNPLLLHHNVHLLRRIPARISRGRCRPPATEVLPAAAPPGSAGRDGAGPPRVQVPGGRGRAGDGAGREGGDRGDGEGAVVGPPVQGARGESRDGRPGLPRRN